MIPVYLVRDLKRDSLKFMCKVTVSWKSLKKINGKAIFAEKIKKKL
jgi:hypothetical protein